MSLASLSLALSRRPPLAVSPTASPQAESSGTDFPPAPAEGPLAGGVAAQGSATGASLPPSSRVVDPARLELIRERLARLSAVPTQAAAVPLGVSALDAALPGGGLGLAGLHRLAAAAGEWDAPAATGFALALAERVRRRSTAGRDRRSLFWIGPMAPHAPGLLSLGVDPGDLLLVRATGESDRLWALEEVLRSGQAAAALCFLRGLDRLAGRRLQLAAERSVTPALVLESRPSGEPVAALSRWRVAARPAAHPDRAGWQVELLQARGGTPAAAEVEWNHATAAFALAAPLCHRMSAACA